MANLEGSTEFWWKTQEGIRSFICSKLLNVKLGSDVWNFFVPVNNTGYATCKICKKKLSYKTTTTNLKKHLCSVHPTISLAWRQKHSHHSPQLILIIQKFLKLDQAILSYCQQLKTVQNILQILNLVQVTYCHCYCEHFRTLQHIL
ncbi:uncharacterized protein LOC128895385 isoform X2 [Hylaeus anthracinus]|uniref:uncharacterized protein LOC128895385 isoform X2 n=1 Tax=Hylaeus anthracinus TaxID=313031 RepID=UPI0023B8B39A|nr:uncharacterized protein LOC128895385 isoform X2 [Hylaeus anthracinus]